MDTDGGGWEMLWKQGGGPDNPSSITATNSMRAGSSQSEYVIVAHWLQAVLAHEV
jgi:hypothetical protein